jgi:LAO/AO transport system kinase
VCPVTGWPVPDRVLDRARDATVGAAASTLRRVDELVEGIRRGERRAIARAISLVEDGAAGLEELSASLFATTGRAHTIGLTGSPGVGKSTLAGELVRTARERDVTVAVLAIDPTSPFTGGALLGDRVRMQTHATDEGVFIRSMATRGHLGGMALAAPEAIRILDAAGFDLVIVETVGVGQAEVDVAAATDTTLVVVAPGWGDHVQVAKAGILEIADVFVVNKADREGADAAARDLRQMVRAGTGDRGWTPAVVATTAARGEGLGELWDAIDEHRAWLEVDGRAEALRVERLAREVGSLATERLRARVAARLGDDPGLVSELAARRVDPYRTASILVERIAGAPEPAAGDDASGRAARAPEP